MVTTADRLVADYLDRLDRAARVLPGGRRRELRALIEAHIQEAVGPADGVAAVATVLDRLGEPEEIVAAEAPGARVSRSGWLEVGALGLLVVGSVVLPLLGWLAGVGLLWWSKVWTTRQKLLGTLVIPGGLGAVVLAAMVGVGVATGTCRPQLTAPPGGGAVSIVGGACAAGSQPGLSQAAWITLLVLLAAAPLVVAAYLGARAYRAR